MALSKNELKTVDKEVCSLISFLQTNQSALWNITLHRTEPTVGIEWMQSQGWKYCRNSTLTKKLRAEVNRLLRTEGVILDGWPTDILNSRRKILAWWSSLTDTDKRGLLHFKGGQLVLSRYVKITNASDPRLCKLIDEINRDLALLRNVGCSQIALEIDNLIKNPSTLWTIPLTYIKDYSGQKHITVCSHWLKAQGVSTRSSSKKNEAIRFRVDELLREEGVIVDNWEIGELNKRRKIFAWWKYLTDEAKRGLAHFDYGRLSISRYVKGLKVTEPKIKKIIDDINNELNVLGNFGNPKITSLINTLKNEPSGLWEIPLSFTKDSTGQSQVGLHPDWLQQKGWSSVSNTKTTNKLRSTFNELLLREGVIIAGGGIADLNLRRKLFAWWKPLTNQQKKGLEHVFSNKLVVSSYVKGAKAKSSYIHYHEALNEIHKELLELGVLKKDYVPLANRLGHNALRKKRMQETIDSLKDEPSKLWDIPLRHSSTYGVLPSSGWLEEQGLKTSGTVDYYRVFLNKLTILLREEGVIIDGWNAANLDIRRKILAWWNPLTEDEKRQLKHYGNQLSIHSYVNGLRSGEHNTSLIQYVLKEINDDLLELGVLDKDYVKVADRPFTRKARNKELKYNERKAKTEAWCKLIDKPLTSVSDLLSVKSREYAQICHLIAATSKKIFSESGKSNFSAACNHFTAFLSASSVPYDTKLEDILNPYVLLRFKKDYILPRVYVGELSPKWANTVLSCIKISLERAKQIKGLNFHTLIEPGLIPADESQRTTDMYRPYSPSVRKQITDAIEKDINEIKLLLKPYQGTGTGVDPFDENLRVISGKGTIENARFIFENYLNCNPVYYFDDSPYSIAFLSIIARNGQSLHNVYKQWGVIPIVSKELLLPLLYKLAQVTGMNADSLIELEIEDYIESHHATGKPCLRYWKERSEGGKEYHLDIFDAELQWLATSQSKIVKHTIDIILKLTERVRVKADKSISSKLFICESASSGNYLTPIRLSALGDEYKKFAARHDVKDSDGRIKSVNIARFRPSFVSEIIEKGVSLREIQLLLGHKSIGTTMNYLDRLDFNRVARKKIDEALKKIKDECDSSNDTSPNANRRYLSNNNNIIFKTPLGGCANVFNPPDFIKKSSLYVEGRPCSQYNKCLSCDNVLITRDHLPELFAMQRDYMQLMTLNRVMDTPYGLVIEENLSLLDEILSLKKSTFSEEELIEGERRSVFVETTILDGIGA